MIEIKYQMRDIGACINITGTGMNKTMRLLADDGDSIKVHLQGDETRQLVDFLIDELMEETRLGREETAIGSDIK